MKSQSRVSICSMSSTIALVSSLVLLSAINGSASTVVVNAQSGPWAQALNPSLNYGVGDNLAPASVGVTAGDSVTISYVSGLTSSFAGVSPSVDANGYVGGPFGSGPDITFMPGFGGSGKPFPSFFINPTNVAPDIWLNELIGAFANASGVVVGNPFAVGNGPLTTTVPTGATQLLLGVNDDIFVGTAVDANGAPLPDNTGSLTISVTDNGLATPLPGALPLFATGLGALGLLGWRRKRKAAASA
jgi:hypothetical protein